MTNPFPVCRIYTYASTTKIRTKSDTRKQTIAEITRYRGDIKRHLGLRTSVVLSVHVVPQFRLISNRSKAGSFSNHSLFDYKSDKTRHCLFAGRNFSAIFAKHTLAESPKGKMRAGVTLWKRAFTWRLSLTNCKLRKSILLFHNYLNISIDTSILS